MCDSWFSCCVSEAPQPRKRPRIDRSMIGEPMNFMHTAHVGSGDMSNTIHSNVLLMNQACYAVISSAREYCGAAWLRNRTRDHHKGLTRFQDSVEKHVTLEPLQLQGDTAYLLPPKRVPQWSVQEQMKSKGGYMEQGDVKTQMIDTKAA